MSKANEVAAWLGETCKCENIRPVRVTIRGTTYEGAEYTDPKHPDSTTPRLYLLGEQPKSRLKRPNKTCFQRDGADWYVAGWYAGTDEDDTVFNEDGTIRHFSQYHPHGRNYLLMPWRVPNDEPIDRYERKPYRFPMTVEYV